MRQGLYAKIDMKGYKSMIIKRNLRSIRSFRQFSFVLLVALLSKGVESPAMGQPFSHCVKYTCDKKSCQTFLAVENQIRKFSFPSAGLTWTSLVSNNSQNQSSKVEPPKEASQDHRFAIFILIGLMSAYLSILRVRPLWLLKVPTSNDIEIPVIKVKIPLGVVRWLKYRDRVLDAWIQELVKSDSETKSRLDTASKTFADRDTVSKRKIHIPLPIELREEMLSELGQNNEALRSKLQSVFSENTIYLMIWGEGGVGKTSLACQIAKWAISKDKEQRLCPRYSMLPILIEDESHLQKTNNNDTSNKVPLLLEEITHQLKQLTKDSKISSEDLVKVLLERKRILVIIDHLSEMDIAIHKMLRNEAAKLPINALVVTSRTKEILGDGITSLKCLRIASRDTWKFMHDYLEQKGKINLYEDTSVLITDLQRLSHMTEEKGDVTALFAKLYLDWRIAAQEGTNPDNAPNNVPNLMLSYLNQLNRNIDEKRREEIQIQEDAKAIAWECLNQRAGRFSPRPIPEKTALEVLQKINPTEAEDRLKYLKAPLRLLLPIEPDKKLQFTLDPLAEYLAALHIVGLYSNCKKDWDKFLNEIDEFQKSEQTSSVSIHGFLRALWDCSEVNQTELGIPSEVLNVIAQKSGLDIDQLKKTQRTRRIRLLISELFAPEPEYRVRAANDLTNFGSEAKVAELNLISILENRNEEILVRQAAAQALGKVGAGFENLITMMENQDEEVNVRQSAAVALGFIGISAEGNYRKKLIQVLGQVLNSDREEVRVRQGAARALTLVGESEQNKVPTLIMKWDDNTEIAKVKYMQIWREELEENILLDMIDIPGGSFQMGSNERSDVEQPVHSVTVASFSMSRYPITQVQWKVVAGLPKIGIDLELEPSSSKGDERPVETITWYEAKEFCERLSQFTKRKYQLPSEAEWEYACRAGTSDTFHFGNTISSDVANFDGNYTYGSGAKGIYRGETTVVGSFGVTNEFGLYDMHGNVWEWCEDHWHEDYKGAPEDGKPWLSDKRGGFRIIRGGCCYNTPVSCRSASRLSDSPDDRDSSLGFRVVCFRSL